METGRKAQCKRLRDLFDFHTRARATLMDTGWNSLFFEEIIIMNLLESSAKL